MRTTARWRVPVTKSSTGTQSTDSNVSVRINVGTTAQGTSSSQSTNPATSQLDTAVSLPIDAVLIAVGDRAETDNVSFWEIHRLPEQPKVDRLFRVFTTGEQVPDNYHYRGTVVTTAGTVLHLMEWRQ